MTLSPPFATSSFSAGGIISPPFATSSEVVGPASSPPFAISSEVVGPGYSPPYSTSTSEIGGATSPPRASADSFIEALGIDGAQIALATIPADRFILQELTLSELAVDSVDTSELVDGSVTPAKLDRTYQGLVGTIAKEAQKFRFITGVGNPSQVEVNDDDAMSFPDGSTTGIRVAFEIPDYYNGVGNIEFFLRVSPSTAFAGDFRIDTNYRRNGGALLGASQSNRTPSPSANVQTLIGPVFALGPGGISAGDGLLLRIQRLGTDITDTHTGAMRLFSVVMRVAV